jgi:hypothetical protein
VGGLAEALDAWLAGPSVLERIIIPVIGHRQVAVETTVSGLAKHAFAMDVAVEELTSGTSLPEAAALVRHWREIASTRAEDRGARLGMFFDAGIRFAAYSILQGVGGSVVSMLPSVFPGGPGSKDLAGLDEAVRSRTIEEVVDFLPMAARLTGFGSEERLKPALTRGLLARNRLAYQTYSPELTVDRDRLCLAVREALVAAARARRFDPAQRVAHLHWSSLASAPATGCEDLQLLREEPLSAAPPAKRRQRGHRKTGRVRPPAGHPPELPVGAAAPLPSAPPVELEATPAPTTVQSGADSGTKPVRALFEFLLTHLPETARNNLDERLKTEGYQGTPASRLLEKCIRVEDPADFIRDEFSRAQLAAIYEAELHRTAPAPQNATQLAREIIEKLGFPSRARPVGLATIMASIDRARPAVQLGTPTEIRAHVTELGCLLEFACLVLIRFLCQAAFREPAEPLLRRWGALGKAQLLSNVGLGTMLGLAQRIDEEIAKDEAATSRLFVDPAHRRRLFPEDLSTLTEVRNAFAHYHEHEGHVSPQDLCRIAVTYVDSARAFLHYLGSSDGRLFPQILLIDGLRVDGWGRKTVTARDDEGKPHVIFTDYPLEAGRVYMMHSRTNPIRVDPILVPAGDMNWPTVH